MLLILLWAHSSLWRCSLFSVLGDSFPLGAICLYWDNFWAENEHIHQRSTLMYLPLSDVNCSWVLIAFHYYSRFVLRTAVLWNYKSCRTFQFASKKMIFFKYISYLKKVTCDLPSNKLRGRGCHCRIFSTVTNLQTTGAVPGCTSTPRFKVSPTSRMNRVPGSNRTAAAGHF